MVNPRADAAAAAAQCPDRVTAIRNNRSEEKHGGNKLLQFIQRRYKLG